MNGVTIWSSFCPWKLSPPSWIDVLSFRSLISRTIFWSFFLTRLPMMLVHQICNRIYIVSSTCSENDYYYRVEDNLAVV